jgi:hypothetical protein
LCQDLRGSRSPPMRLDNDMCRRIVVSLEKVIRLKTSCPIRYDDLAILTTRLNMC